MRLCVIGVTVNYHLANQKPTNRSGLSCGLRMLTSVCPLHAATVTQEHYSTQHPNDLSEVY